MSSPISNNQTRCFFIAYLSQPLKGHNKSAGRGKTFPICTTSTWLKIAAKNSLPPWGWVSVDFVPTNWLFFHRRSLSNLWIFYFPLLLGEGHTQLVIKKQGRDVGTMPHFFRKHTTQILEASLFALMDSSPKFGHFNQMNALGPQNPWKNEGFKPSK